MWQQVTLGSGTVSTLRVHDADGKHGELRFGDQHYPVPSSQDPLTSFSLVGSNQSAARRIHSASTTPSFEDRLLLSNLSAILLKRLA
jgi:hypothetical protein